MRSAYARRPCAKSTAFAQAQRRGVLRSTWRIATTDRRTAAPLTLGCYSRAQATCRETRLRNSCSAELSDQPEPAWVADIDQVIFRGSFAMQEVVFFHRRSRTAIFTDLIQKFERAELHGWRGAAMILDGLVGPDGSTPREWWLSFWNRRAARAALRKALQWNPRRLLIAHGTWVRENGREALARSLRWLDGRTVP